MKSFNTPVLFLIFNRPQTTEIVFARIKEIKPAQLFIAADGARNHVAGEHEICEKLRSSVLGKIDWSCEVHTLFQSENRGCKNAVSTAISWFFNTVEQGIILEDDCLPDISFFTFCETLLEKYKNQDIIKHISGNNFQQGNIRGYGDYYYSKFNHIWGWATWKRAWLQYDVQMNGFDENKAQDIIKKIFPGNQSLQYWMNVFKQTHAGNIDTWDYQWTYAIWKNEGLCILPQKNLVANIGFGKDATHTTEEANWMANLKTNSLSITQYPEYIVRSKKADVYTCNTVFGIKENDASVFKWLKKKLKAGINKMFSN